MKNQNFANTYYGKKVLVTGHTGFKGGWLIAWLKYLGAKVVGISLDPLTSPSLFDAANLSDGIEDYRIDICNGSKLNEAIKAIRPDFVFHLAAQALVRRSYENPVETWNTNLNGTVNLLESLRNLDNNCSVVFITSDKCYDNVEWYWGYRETDALGGPDPYSASKGAAELAIRSYIKSYFSNSNNKVRIASARAGNVIGGGDWSPDRIVPDCVRSWSENNIVELRNPFSTRPWQHVLEPLSGYLSLAHSLSIRPELHGEPFNFGPQSHCNYTVLELVNQMALNWEQVRWKDVSGTVKGPYESGLLKLNCDKALHMLNWNAVMNFEDTVRMTADWYQSFYKKTANISDFTTHQIENYSSIAKAKGVSWAK